MKKPQLTNALKIDPSSYKHQAFGTLRLSVVSGGNPTLFGSDIKHAERVSVTISTASLKRDGGQDRISSGDEFLKFEMSHAQLASFILSSGRHEGTPITFTRMPQSIDTVVRVPGINLPETKAELHQREVRESAARQVADLTEKIQEFGDKLSAGKLGIKEARDLQRALAIAVGNLPLNMAFTVNQAHEAIEHAKEAAKLEIDAYISNAATQLGMKSLEEVSLLVRDKIEHVQQLANEQRT